MKLGVQVGLGLATLCYMETQLPSPKGHSRQFSAHICCGQMAAWMKMPLGMELGLGPGHIVLDWDPATLLRKGRTAPNFQTMSIVAKRPDGQDATC